MSRQQEPYVTLVSTHSARLENLKNCLLQTLTESRRFNHPHVITAPGSVLRILNLLKRTLLGRSV